MRKYELIFDILKDVREYSEKHNLDAVIAAVKRAENLALIEILNISSEINSSGYDTVLAASSPVSSNLKH